MSLDNSFVVLTKYFLDYYLIDYKIIDNTIDIYSGKDYKIYKYKNGIIKKVEHIKESIEYVFNNIFLSRRVIKNKINNLIKKHYTNLNNYYIISILFKSKIITLNDISENLEELYYNNKLFHLTKDQLDYYNENGYNIDNYVNIINKKPIKSYIRNLTPIEDNYENYLKLIYKTKGEEYTINEKNIVEEYFTINDKTKKNNYDFHRNVLILNKRIDIENLYDIHFSLSSNNMASSIWSGEFIFPNNRIKSARSYINCQ